MSNNWREATRSSDRWWPPIGARVRYRSSRGGALTGEVVSDPRATCHRVAIRRDGEKQRRVVFRNRTLVEWIDGG